MKDLSVALSIIERLYGTGKAQLVSDLLTEQKFVPVEGAEEECKTLEEIDVLTNALDKLIEELPESLQDAADKLAGGFLSLGGAIAYVEVQKRCEGAERDSGMIIGYFFEQ